MLEVAPGIFVATSRRDCTTSTMLVADGAVVLVDPAWELDELESLADAMAARGWTVEAGIATHSHYDHVLWHPRFGRAPRWASDTTVATVESRRSQLIGRLGEGWPAAVLDTVARLDPLTPGRVISERLDIGLVEHDAHQPGHTAVWVPQHRVLLAGDMLSDIELPLPLDADDLTTYVDGLETLAPYVGRAEVLVPGHGHPTTDPLARLDADRAYLDGIIAGREPDDARRHNLGMSQVHRELVEANRR